MKLFDFLSTEPGVISSFILIAALTISIGTGGTMVMKYLNYQNTLDKVMDCRKVASSTSVVRLDDICGKIPQWKDY